MKNIKVIVSVMIILTMFSTINVCYSANTNLLDTIFGMGNSWFNGSSGTDERIRKWNSRFYKK